MKKLAEAHHVWAMIRMSVTHLSQGSVAEHMQGLDSGATSGGRVYLFGF